MVYYHSLPHTLGLSRVYGQWHHQWTFTAAEVDAAARISPGQQQGGSQNGIPTECFLSGIDQSKVDNSTEEWLDTIEDKLEYEVWYLGHWHTDKQIHKMYFLFHGVETL